MSNIDQTSLVELANLFPEEKRYLVSVLSYQNGCIVQNIAVQREWYDIGSKPFLDYLEQDQINPLFTGKKSTLYTVALFKKDLALIKESGKCSNVIDNVEDALNIIVKKYKALLAPNETFEHIPSLFNIPNSWIKGEEVDYIEWAKKSGNVPILIKDWNKCFSKIITSALNISSNGKDWMSLAIEVRFSWYEIKSCTNEKDYMDMFVQKSFKTEDFLKGCVKIENYRIIDLIFDFHTDEKKRANILKEYSYVINK